ncbi:MAG: hypothetical protein IEMM0008_1232 [bacterium]|nr:MAG: hypothetical protein IEMM0008_1232 [bacterium]
MFSFINELHFRRQAETLRERRNRQTTRGRGVRCFDENDEVASATKGFSEEDEVRGSSKDDSDLFNDNELAATTEGFYEVDERDGIGEQDEVIYSSKGFSVNNELTSHSTGFNRNVEKQYSKSHRKYRYDLVNKIDK